LFSPLNWFKFSVYRNPDHINRSWSCTLDQTVARLRHRYHQDRIDNVPSSPVTNDEVTVLNPYSNPNVPFRIPIDGRRLWSISGASTRRLLVAPASIWRDQILDLVMDRDSETSRCELVWELSIPSGDSIIDETSNWEWEDQVESEEGRLDGAMECQGCQPVHGSDR
ncbi:hypothetical protein PMAYCL1PPCAC_07371, partial [Pristionchus mayeri]